MNRSNSITSECQSDKVSGRVEADGCGQRRSATCYGCKQKSSITDALGSIPVTWVSVSGDMSSTNTPTPPLPAERMRLCKPSSSALRNRGQAPFVFVEHVRSEP